MGAQKDRSLEGRGAVASIWGFKRTPHCNDPTNIRGREECIDVAEVEAVAIVVIVVRQPEPEEDGEPDDAFGA